MKQNKIIAITGGIGSGKSTVSKILSELGYKVYNCDKIYADLLNSGAFNDDFLREFGNVFNMDGSINRAMLSEIVFNNEEKLKILNAITHKKVFEQVFTLANAEANTCFIEVPLLFESGAENDFCNVLIVLRDEKERIEAVIKRDNLTEKQIKSRINKQFDYSSADLSKYHIIVNDGSIEDLKKRVVKLIMKLV